MNSFIFCYTSGCILSINNINAFFSSQLLLFKLYIFSVNNLMNFKFITEWNIISLTYSNKMVLLSFFSVTRRHNAFIKWTKNWRDLVTVVLLWIDNMTKTTLINVLNLWLAYSFLGLVCYQHVWCCSICLEWCPATGVKREERITLSQMWALENLQSHPFDLFPPIISCLLILLIWSKSSTL